MMADGEDTILLEERYEILANQRQPNFDSFGVEAFAVRDREQRERTLFALICPGHLPCRAFGISGKRPSTQAPVLWPEASGIVDWPIMSANSRQPVWGRRPVLIFEPPKGERFQFDLNAQYPPVTEQVLTKTVTMPIMQALQELSGLGIAHRGIRPNNIFYANGNGGPLMLGECLSTPAGAGQPVLFEPIEHAIADPMGRGPGIGPDDIYALGVLLVVLHAGRNPVAGMSDDEIILGKINVGSFNLLAGRERLAPSMIELLRGLLNDDPANRWTQRHIDAWLTGQHFNPPVAHLPQRAGRPIGFMDREHMTKPALAYALATNWRDGLRFIDDVAFENWLRRGFGEDKAAEQLARVWAGATSPGPSTATKDRVLSRIIMMLHMQSPICYRNLRVDLAGMGSLLSHVLNDEDLAIQFGEMLRGRLPGVWIQHQQSLSAAYLQVRRTMEEIDKVVDRPAAGFGLERALYELEPLAPCRSPMVADFYVIHLRDLLPAIDAVIASMPAGTEPIDRHIAAFIAAHLRRSIERELNVLHTATEESDRAVAMLRLLAIVQHMHPNDKLPRLTATVTSMLRPAIDAFHNKEARSNIEIRVRKLAEKCDLAGMLQLFEADGQHKRSDQLGFTAAKRAFSLAEQHAQWLQKGGLTNRTRVNAIANRTSALIAAFTASASIAIYSVFAMW